MEQSQPLSNATSYLPSPADLFMVFPRLLSRAGALGEHLDTVFGKIRSGGSLIAEPTTANVTNASAITTAGKFVQETLAAASPAAATMQGDLSIIQALKNVGTFFNYVTSKWAIATFTIGILLNRTHFYASSRVPLSFDRIQLRLALYLIPTIMFLYRIRTVLQTIRCQTDPGWSEMQYGASGRQLDTDFGGEAGYLWRVASTFLFYESIEDSCRSVNMYPEDPSLTRQRGSLALLWPLFMSLGFGHFVETMSCALQGRHPVQEVGMTIFEHSLAFAEAEAVVTRPFTFDATRLSRFSKPRLVTTPDGTALTLNRATLNTFANVPPEVLLISLISCASHLTSNVLAITGQRSKIRILTTGIWGLAYMASFTWSFIRFAALVSEPGQQIGLLRFPTVCIVGFIPHVLVLMGICACSIIYALAFGLTVLNPPPDQSTSLTWKQRCTVAYGNLHANIHLSAITPLTLNWNEDFYTAILKIGFTVLTAASEAVYLNEGPRVNVHSMTWLEKEKFEDLLARRRQFRQKMADIPTELGDHMLAPGLEILQYRGPESTAPASVSGYARERKTKGPLSKTEPAISVGRNNGVGIEERCGRWTLSYRFVKGILMLLLAIQAKLLITALTKLRITYIPRVLARAAGPQTAAKSTAPASASYPVPGPEPWLVVDEQTRVRPDDSFDVETFSRNKLYQNSAPDGGDPENLEERLSDYLYGWWKAGGRWGDVDASADYTPSREDDEISIVSSVSENEDEAWSDVEDVGQRTPTQSDHDRYSKTSTGIAFNLAHLSHLLDPRSEEHRAEAKLLSRHLQSAGVMTRSQYRKGIESDEFKLLASSRGSAGDLSKTLRLTPEEEQDLLQDFILHRRSASLSQGPHQHAASWDTGAEGMGSEGPQCVVCQLSPRTVLVWPCGCLSLCDECRVGLASKNYTTCVCCRTTVLAYSKLYVP